MSLHNLFYPRGVVLVGSVSEGKLGWQVLRKILDGGYKHVYAVNPKAQGAFSVSGFKSATEIGQPVDMAVIVAPTATVPAVLEDCGQAGVRAAVIVSAGFSEVGNHAGESQVKQAAQRYGIRFIGPNCAGLVNTSHHLYPTLETHPPAGGVAIIAQSGAVGGVITAWAKEFGLGISKFVSYGNGADLTEIDFLRYLADDSETKVVALYIESTSDGREFMQAMRECSACKPVVVIKAGRTGSGQRATLSHTGSMAGADAVYDAALRQSGAIRVHSIEEMFDLCKGFLYLPPLHGRRVAIVTNSGGPAVLAADRAEELGLDVAEPSPLLKAKLSESLPAHCALKNPFDLTVEGTEDSYRKTLLAVAQEYDAVLALNIATPYLDSVALARGVCDAARQSGKPVAAAFLPHQIVAAAVNYLQVHGVPNFATGERAVAALARMAQYQEFTSQACHSERAHSPSTPPPRSGGQGVASEESLSYGAETLRRFADQGDRNGQLLEPEAMAWLRENNIPTPEFRFVTTVEEAMIGCREIGYPVVMKVVSPDILHKSEWGGVKLDIYDEAAARAAFDALQHAATGKDFRGVVIYPMIRGAQEVLMGITRDLQFGPVVMFGAGGIYTEVLHDTSLRVAPVDRTEAQAMIREIRSFPILEGVRGQPRCDLDALADMLVSFSRLPFRYPEIVELDLNPVFVFPKGLMVGDVRVIRKEENHDAR
jgi:acyl-CoA synthetase (NDP forming)